LKDLDVDFFRSYQQLPELDLAPIDYFEPDLESELTIKRGPAQGSSDVSEQGEAEPTNVLGKIGSKVVRLPDFIDTDAVSSRLSRIRTMY